MPLDSDIQMSENESISTSCDHTNNQTINQSIERVKKTNELLRYDFIIPLLLAYFTDHDVLTRLLIICKSIKRFMSHYRIQNSVTIQKASFIAEHYWPAMLTQVNYLNPSDLKELASFPSLTGIALRDHEDDFDVSLIPASITQMERSVFGAFDSHSFPVSLTSLVLNCFDEDSHYNDLQPNSLPPHLKSLTLDGDGFEIPAGFLPNTLTELNIKGYLSNDCDLSIFPASLTSLTVTVPFEATLILPASLLKLAIQGPWSSDLFPKGLPPNLESFELTFEDLADEEDFPEIEDEEIEFPTTLTCLQLYQRAAPGVIPNTVTHLTYHARVTEEDEWALRSDVIPDSVTHLDLLIDDTKTYSTHGMLPSSITDLTISIPTDDDNPISIGFIPSSVTRLTWGTDDDWPTGIIITSMCVPVSLAPCGHSHICGCPRVQMGYNSSIPASVKQLTFGNKFNQLLKPGDIPRSVTHLTFGSAFDVELVAGAIPDSVTNLSFGDDFNQPLTADSIPDSVQYLQFGKLFNQPLPAEVLPTSLKRLSFARQQKPPINVDHVTVDVAYLTNY